jgi:hypothetical protein
VAVNATAPPTSREDNATIDDFFDAMLPSFYTSFYTQTNLTPESPASSTYVLEVERIFTIGKQLISHARYFVPSDILGKYYEVHAKDVFCGDNPVHVTLRQQNTVKYQTCNVHQRREGGMVSRYVTLIRHTWKKDEGKLRLTGNWLKRSKENDWGT